MPKARHRKFRELGRRSGVDFRMAFASNPCFRYFARDVETMPRAQVGSPFGDPVSLAKKPLTLAGSNHPDDAENGDKDANPRPIDAPA